ncbi:MAG: hypothetical protein WKG32_12355 [Gemmatimonadaceae bacterium]
MAVDRPSSLEQALTRTDADAEAALKAANAAVRALKRFRAAAHTGDLRELQKALETAEQTISALAQQFANAKQGWDFDVGTYLSGADFPQEILQTAKQMDVKIFEEDERLYCYPHLIRVLPNDQAVLIDKTRERRLRPSVLVGHLKALQNKPVRFRPEAFLESLWSAYATAVKAGKRDGDGSGTIIPLVEIYELLTLLPGQAKEYSRQEFARDVYLLDKSGVSVTRRGVKVSWPASSGTRSQGKTITVITQDGREKKYYGIAFANA